jgi:AraC-like DNA-binding protein
MSRVIRREVNGLESQYTLLGLSARHSTEDNQPWMPNAHTHSEIELNYVETGDLVYLLGGQVLKVPRRNLCVFWGTRPHVILEYTAKTSFYSIHIPLTWFLSWQLPGELSAAIINGEFMYADEDERAKRDLHAFQDWYDLLSEPDPDSAKIALLEMEARLLRLARAGANTGQPLTLHRKDKTQVHKEGLSKVVDMAAFVAEHFREEIALQDIADAAGVSRFKAVRLFSEVCGTSLVPYLTRQRLSHAQFLLITTEDSVLDIAYASGFGSVSWFHRAFIKAYQQTPLQYRKSNASTRS